MCSKFSKAYFTFVRLQYHSITFINNFDSTKILTMPLLTEEQCYQAIGILVNTRVTHLATFFNNRRKTIRKTTDTSIQVELKIALLPQGREKLHLLILGE